MKYLETEDQQIETTHAAEFLERLKVVNLLLNRSRAVASCYLYPLNKKLEKGFEELLQRSFTLRLINSSMKSMFPAAKRRHNSSIYAMLTTFNEVDMTNLMKLRCDFKDASVEKHGVKLGLMLRFIKVAVSGLQNQTTINEVIDGDDIIYRDYIDISVAVGTPKGLVVPVIRNADKMNCGEMEKEINSLAKKANEAFN